MNTPKSAFLMALCAATLLVCGCAPTIMPALQPHTTDVNALSRTMADTPQSASATAWPAPDWVRQFGDPQLDQLVAEAYAHNPDLQIAKARIGVAQSQLQQFSSLTGLTATAGASVNKARMPQSNGVANVSANGYDVPVQLFSDPVQSPSSIFVGLNYQLDLWGRNAAATRGLLSLRDAARVDAEQARLTLAIAIVSLYCDLDQAYALHDLWIEKRDASDQITAVLRERAARGIDNGYDADDAAVRRNKLITQIELADERIQLAQLQLGVLSGGGPERGLSLTRPRPANLVDTPLPSRLSADLLGRRPDIVAARLRVEASYAAIDGTRAEFYPDVNLVGFAGLLALTPGAMFSRQALAGSVGPAVSLPVFDRGRLKAKLSGDAANADVAIGLYNKTIDSALGDVARTLVSLKTVDRLVSGERDAADAAQRYVSIAEERHRRGLLMQKDVNTAKLTLYDERAQLIDLQAQRRTLRVALIGALGGGFDERTLPGPAISHFDVAFPSHDRLTDRAADKPGDQTNLTHFN
ncbi:MULTISPECIES: efflux transporter outer membrane subunit [unclassified Paraburkholderia]|uniref:efflux transporter outer membrane subunit n=1 Tax=unclassified Paraburkholderia TaxID=2615204 RepID=UPI002AB25793|nr:MULTISPECIES: efflux transporter outer membrane subunit [unclassified Paraburkholderia]